MSYFTDEGLWKEALARSRRMAQALGFRAELAEEIAQEALLRAWRHRARLRSREQFFAWLRTIVRNEAARLGARDQRQSLGPVFEEAAEDQALMTAGMRIDLQRSIAALSEPEREIIRLRYSDDLTQPAIAERMGMPEGTVKIILHRARKKMRESLGEDGSD